MDKICDNFLKGISSKLGLKVEQTMREWDRLRSPFRPRIMRRLESHYADSTFTWPAKGI